MYNAIIILEALFSLAPVWVHLPITYWAGRCPGCWKRSRKPHKGILSSLWCFRKAWVRQSGQAHVWQGNRQWRGAQWVEDSWCGLRTIKKASLMRWHLSKDQNEAINVRGSMTCWLSELYIVYKTFPCRAARVREITHSALVFHTAGSSCKWWRATHLDRSQTPTGPKRRRFSNQ